MPYTLSNNENLELVNGFFINIYHCRISLLRGLLTGCIMLIDYLVFALYPSLKYAT